MDKLLELLVRIFGNITSWRSIVSFLIIVAIVLWVDSQMGFSYHYFTQRKIEEIAAYNNILKEPSLESVTKSLLLVERLIIIKKGRALAEPINMRPRDNSNLFYLSFSWIYIILLLFSYRLIRNSQPYATLKKVLGMVTWIVVILLMELVILYLIASALSLYVQHFYLYIINTALQIILLSLTFFLTNKIEKAIQKKAV